MTAAPEISAAFILLAPFAAAGLALINTGLGRSRSAAHAMLASLLVIAVAALAFFVCGFAFQGYPSGPAHALTVSGKAWNWLGAERPFFRGLQFDGSIASLAALLGMFSAGIVGLIPLGAGADRWRLGACCASTAVLSGFVFPVFSHWAQGGGWLAQCGYVDAGGAGAIHTVGGLTALSITWILGPRRGKFSSGGLLGAIPGHNAVLVLFGCLLAWVGWIGLNSAGATLFAGAAPAQTILIAVNTTLAAATAALGAAAITRTRFGKPDASLCANGWVSGLVAVSAGCAVVSPLAAVAIGLAAGVLVPVAIEFLEGRLTIDDPTGAISVHGIAGIWGVLAPALFAPGRAGWLPQLAAVATLLGFVLPLAYGLNRALDRFYPQRVSSEGERHGMDLHELGAGAYPEFLTHNEDFSIR